MFFGDVCVVMFDIGVLCFLPKCAVNGDILVVVLGIIFISWMISTILSASVIFDHLGSLFRTERRRLLFVLVVLSFHLLCGLQLGLILV